MTGFDTSPLLDILFPMRCSCCGKPVSNRDDCLCRNCREEIVPASGGCETCSGEMVDGKCTVCSDRQWYLERNIAATEYTGAMKEIIHNYKFSRRKRLYRHIAAVAVKAIDAHEAGANFDIVTCVPMSRTKIWKRGFNQSEVIARAISRKTGRKYYRLLKEKVLSKTQRNLKYEERFINILDRYRVSGKKMKGMRVLLVDDIFTTGATINECARVLLSGGASSVSALTISRARIKSLENLKQM
jgi:competence protein ComFC